MPISPLAKPRPSTTATITEAPEVVDTEELLVPVQQINMSALKYQDGQLVVSRSCVYLGHKQIPGFL